MKRFVPLIALLVIIGALLACSESSNTDATANTSNASPTSDVSATPSPTPDSTLDSTLDSAQSSDQQQSAQQPAQNTGVNGNPWGYDFNPGSLIYSPNSGFCNYFSCVTTFWKSTNGYVVECGNDKYSHSGGVKDVCSRDGGVQATLYQHP